MSTTVLDRARRIWRRPTPSTRYPQSPPATRDLTIWEQARAKAGPVEWRSSVRPGDWHVLRIALALVLSLATVAFCAALALGYRTFPWG